MTDMLVELRDLRRALVATKPHIPQPKDDPRLAPSVVPEAAVTLRPV